MVQTYVTGGRFSEIEDDGSYLNWVLSNESKSSRCGTLKAAELHPHGLRVAPVPDLPEPKFDSAPGTF